MSYTFICTPQKEWWLKITTIEQLLDYWKGVFNPMMQQALDTIEETEFRQNKRIFRKRHADYIQGSIAQRLGISNKDACDEIMYDNRNAQYKALCEGKTIYINKKGGWNVSPKITEQFIHKEGFDFPIMEKDKIKIEQFLLGAHYYVFMDGVQLRKEENLKFNSYQEALDFAEEYVK